MRNASLDALRALAITLVFLFHYQLHGGPISVHAVGQFGWAGVDLFFVLSGYLIAGQLLRDRPALADFYRRRAFRILPAYLAVLAAYFLLPELAEAQTIAPLWKFLTFTQNFGLDLRSERAFSNAWSLCMEEQFYLVLPITLLALRRFFTPLRVAVSFAAIIALGIFLRAHAWMNLPSADFVVAYYKNIYYPSYCRLDPLLFGVGISAWQNAAPEMLARHRALLLAAGAAILTSAIFFCSEKTGSGTVFDMRTYRAAVFGYPLVAFGFAAVVAGAAHFPRLSFPGARGLAELAFSIYLVHKPVMHALESVPLSPGVLFMLTVAATLLCAGVLRVTIELPFLRLRSKTEA